MLAFDMRQAERVAAVLETLAADGTVDVTALVERLGVSAATVRRDLQLLEQQRMLSRTHGGAVAHDVLYELPLRYKAARHQAEKKRIASEAATRVADGSVVGLSGPSADQSLGVFFDLVGRDPCGGRTVEADCEHLSAHDSYAN